MFVVWPSAHAERRYRAVISPAQQVSDETLRNLWMDDASRDWRTLVNVSVRTRASRRWMMPQQPANDAPYKRLRSSTSSFTRHTAAPSPARWRLKRVDTPTASSQTPDLCVAPFPGESPPPPPLSSELSFRSAVKAMRESSCKNGIIGLEDLFALKSAHCRFTEPLLRDLKTLRAKSAHLEAETRHSLEMRIADSYALYQSCLEHCRVEDELSTTLTHRIMCAEAFWNMAKLVSIDALRSHCYAVARQRYAQVLTLAENRLNADDLSTLRLLYKVTRLLAESTAHHANTTAHFLAPPLSPPSRLGDGGDSAQQPPGAALRRVDRFDGDDIAALTEKCRRAAANAEERMEGTAVDLSKERKLIKIKNNLMRLAAPPAARRPAARPRRLK